VIVGAVWLAAGLAAVIKGGHLFVAASVRIAELLRLPRVVIGSTLVSLATTSPELVVSIMAGLRAEPGLALGNAVGSCLCNTTLVLGVMAALKRIDVHPAALRVPLGTMLGLAVLLFILTLDLEVSRAQGAALVLVGAGYFAHDLHAHSRAARSAVVAEAGAIERQAVAGHPWLLTGWGTAAQFAAGAVLVLGGSRLLVDGAVSLAAALGIPPMVVGLTVVALGTSAPELVTAVSSSRRNVSDLGVGNVVGANIANLSLIVGTAAAISPVSIERPEQLFNVPAMVGAMAVVATMLLRRGRISRRAGIGLLAFYGVYLAGLVALSAVTRR
jgi:cation:H+ antiporter